MKYQDHLDLSALRAYASGLNARSRQHGNGGLVDAGQLRDRILASGGRCEWCGVDLVDADFELDHVLSLKQRGSNSGGNLAVTCPDCNRRKSRKHPARFAAEILGDTGVRTPLITRVLRAYGAEAYLQRSLFGGDASFARAAVEIEDELSQTPPYNWTE